MSYLVRGKQQGIGNHYVLSTPSSKDNHFCDIFWGQWITAAIQSQHCPAFEPPNLRVNCIRLFLVELMTDIVEFLRRVSSTMFSRAERRTVSTCPGSTVMTRIRVPISSLRSDSVNERIAALLEQYICSITVSCFYHMIGSDGRARTVPPAYGSLPAILPNMIISPFPPSGRFLNVGRTA